MFFPLNPYHTQQTCAHAYNYIFYFNHLFYLSWPVTTRNAFQYWTYSVFIYIWMHPRLCSMLFVICNFIQRITKWDRRRLKQQANQVGLVRKVVFSVHPSGRKLKRVEGLMNSIKSMAIRQLGLRNTLTLFTLDISRNGKTLK